MAQPTYIKSNLLHMFYAMEGSTSGSTEWKYFGYIQSNGLNLSNSFTEISSKMHGIHPDQEISGSTVTLSQSAYCSTENCNTILKMAQDGNIITWCFCKVAENAQVANDGLSGVTGYGDVSAYTPGSDFKKYLNGIVSSASITSNSGEVATIDLEIQGIGALRDSIPSPVNYYSAS